MSAREQKCDDRLPFAVAAAWLQNTLAYVQKDLPLPAPDPTRLLPCVRTYVRTYVCTYVKPLPLQPRFLRIPSLPAVTRGSTYVRMYVCTYVRTYVRT